MVLTFKPYDALTFYRGYLLDTLLLLYVRSAFQLWDGKIRVSSQLITPIGNISLFCFSKAIQFPIIHPPCIVYYHATSATSFRQVFGRKLITFKDVPRELISNPLFHFTLREICKVYSFNIAINISLSS
jgi:hypothetical protein